MTGQPSLYLHAGLPRSGTTVLQRSFFPGLRPVRYVGKNAGNATIPPGKVHPYPFMAQLCESHSRGDPDALAKMERVFTTIFQGWKVSLLRNDEGDAARFLRLWVACIERVGELLPDKPRLYSEEGFIESLSGLTGNPQRSDRIFLEDLGSSGVLEHARVCVVTRNPADFLAASYYKAMEVVHMGAAAQPQSFGEFIRVQLLILDRKPAASRIFLALPRCLSAYLRKLAPDVRIADFADLLSSSDVASTVLGLASGEPVAFESLPRENASWRNAEVNEWLLSAPGVPAGIGIDDYRKTFTETLERHGLMRLFADEAVGAQDTATRPHPPG